VIILDSQWRFGVSTPCLAWSQAHSPTTWVRMYYKGICERHVQQLLTLDKNYLAHNPSLVFELVKKGNKKLKV
jgi:hypothetical protein